MLLTATRKSTIDRSRFGFGFPRRMWPLNWDIQLLLSLSCVQAAQWGIRGMVRLHAHRTRWWFRGEQIIMYLSFICAPALQLGYLHQLEWCCFVADRWPSHLHLFSWQGAFTHIIVLYSNRNKVPLWFNEPFILLFGFIWNEISMDFENCLQRGETAGWEVLSGETGILLLRGKVFLFFLLYCSCVAVLTCF